MSRGSSDERTEGPERSGVSPTAPVPLGVRRGLRARLFAWSLGRSDAAQRRLYGDRKARLFDGLEGTVVEIGAGTGLNAAYLPAGTRWIAVEPNVHFHSDIRRAAARNELTLEIVSGAAEALPLPDGAADAVISTLVLCSVASPTAALAEARRVLRPGGRLVVIEHVAAPEGTVLRRFQRALRRPWGWVADGCRPDRDTASAIRAAGFASVELERFQAPLGLASPHIMGVAVR